MFEKKESTMDFFPTPQINGFVFTVSNNGFLLTKTSNADSFFLHRKINGFVFTTPQIMLPSE